MPLLSLFGPVRPTDQLPDHPGTRVLALGAAPLRVDGPTLLALLRGYPVVGASWQAAQPPACPRSMLRPAARHPCLPVSCGCCVYAGKRHLPPTRRLTLPPACRPFARRLLEWQQQQVWRNSRPEEGAYPVQLQYEKPGGRVTALAGPAALLRCAGQRALAGRSLLWLPAARDAALQEAARLLGAANSEADAMPASYRKLAWTTPQLLIVRAQLPACPLA